MTKDIGEGMADLKACTLHNSEHPRCIRISINASMKDDILRRLVYFIVKPLIELKDKYVVCLFLFLEIVRRACAQFNGMYVYMVTAPLIDIKSGAQPSKTLPQKLYY